MRNQWNYMFFTALLRYLHFHSFFKKILEDDLFKISNQFQSSSVELNMDNNSNWGRKKHRTTKSNKNVNFRALTSFADKSKSKRPAA